MNTADALKDDGSLTAASLIAHLQTVRNASCTKCGARICGHQVLMSIAMGFKQAPLCVNCLSKALDQESPAMLDYICAYIQRRECYRGAWEWACEDESELVKTVPDCLK